MIRARNYLLGTFTLLALSAIAWIGFKIWVPVILGRAGPIAANVERFPGFLLYGYAFFAGLITFAAPCAIGILPAYASFYFNLEGGSPEGTLKRSLYLGSIAAAGPIIVYTIAGLVLWLAYFSFRFLFEDFLLISAWTKPVVIVLLVGIGLALLADYSPETSRAFGWVRRRLNISGARESVFSFGLLYGVGSLGCGLLVFVPMMLLGLAGGRPLVSLTALAVYVIAFGLGMVGVTTLIGFSNDTFVARVVASAPLIKRGMGVVVLLGTAWLINFYLKTGGM